MNISRENLAERVRKLVERDGRSPSAISKAVTGKPELVRNIYRLKSIPGIASLEGLARELNTTTDYLLGKVDNPDQVRSEVRFAEMPQAWRGEEGEGVPVMGTAFCDDLAVEGEDGEPFEVERVLLEFDHIVTMIERPRALWAARDAYAIYLEGSSMEPRYKQGHLCIVDPRRPPGPGDDVVVQLNDGNGGNDVITVIVKELVRASSKFVELRQFNPDSQFRIPRRQVTALHRICNSNELFGI